MSDDVLVAQTEDVIISQSAGDATITADDSSFQITVPQQGPVGPQGPSGDTLVQSVAGRIGHVTIGSEDIEDATVNGRQMMVAANFAAMRLLLSLDQVDNTSDVNKPISDATQDALDLKADLASPALTGNPTAPNQSAGTNNTRIANTAYVDAAIAVLAAVVSGAVIFKGSWDASSGAFPGTAGRKTGWFYKVSVAGTTGGVPFSVGDDIYAVVDNASTTTYANNWLKIEGTITLAEVEAAVGFTFGSLAALSTVTAALISDASANGRSLITASNYAAMKTLLSLNNVDNTSDASKPVSTAQAAAIALKADIADPAFTGNPTATTQSAGNNSTRLATTAYVDTAVAGGFPRVGFSAHKNNTTQPINNSGETKVTFGTESYDYGNYYDTANSRWTPPAGLVLITAAVVSNTVLQTSGNYFYLAIYKNNSVVKFWQGPKANADDGCFISITDYANGSDYYEVFCYGVANSGGSFTLSGTASATFFSGVYIR